MTAPRAWTLAALLVLSALAEPAEAQSRAVVVTGRVVTPEGTPALLAAVTVTALDDQSATVELTDGDGRFRAVMEHRAPTYAVSARLRGFVAQSKPVSVGVADSAVIVPEIRLVRAAQEIAAVKVVSRRPPPVRSQGRYGLYTQKPGESQISIDPSGGFGSALTGDASGDMTLALGAVPGLSATLGANGALAFSLAGLGADQNRLMVNGSEMVVAPPRERGVLRISTTGYDPTIAMSGARAEWVIVGANYVTDRRLRLTMDVRPLQVTTPMAAAFGQHAGAPTMLSGVFAGPMWPRSRSGLPKFLTTQFDVSRRVGSVSTLASTDASTLDALGVGGESVRRILSTRTSLGLAPFANELAARRSTTAKLFARVDLAEGGLGSIWPNATGGASALESQDQSRVFYLLFGGSTTRESGSLVGPLTLPSYATDHSSTGLTAQAFHSFFPREFIVNETRVTLSAERVHGGPVSGAPGASVIAGSSGPDQLASIATVQVAGSGTGTEQSRYAMTQLYNETQWSSVGRRHQWKVGLEALLDAASSASGAGAGRFGYASLDQFAANRPAVYSRTLSRSVTDAHGVHLAAGLGDEYQPSKAWAWQYGVRVEGHRVRSGAGTNPLVDSIFGVRTGAIPMKLSVSPMVGFTWFYARPPGRTAMGFPRGDYSLVGGIRDYRGALSTRGAQRALAQNGLTDAARELLCVGDAVPVPDWRAYEASSASVPDRCADGSIWSPLSELGTQVSAYSPDYTQSHSWRADLAWNARLSRRLFSSLRGRLALNTHLPAPFDVNFAGDERFTLGAEHDRPVFVSPQSFDPPSGRTTSAESRRSTGFGPVTELRSDLRSSDASLTATLDFRPSITGTSSARALPFTVSYTLTKAREQSQGFIGSTAGDPRRVECEPGQGSRHTIYLASALHVPDWGRLTVGLRAWSGFRYTPSVLGDVNGDGRSGNDRAFVFDPRSSTDGAVSSGMTALLASAPGAAARCLRAQLGSIAGANSCTGPWSATLSSSLVVDPARIGLRNRGQLQLQIVNGLAAVDRLLHGSSGVRGWGGPALVDPVLLRVSGFDRATRRPVYAVNPSFGNPRSLRGFAQSPFRVSVDVRLDVGPNREREALARRLAPEGAGPRVRLDSAQLVERIANPFRLLDPLVKQATTLELTEVQRNVLDSLSVRYEADKDSIFRALAGYLAARDGDVGDRDARRHWHDAHAAVGWRLWETGRAVRAILSDSQWERLFGDVRPYVYEYFRMDRLEAARMLAGWQTFSF